MGQGTLGWGGGRGQGPGHGPGPGHGVSAGHGAGAGQSNAQQLTPLHAPLWLHGGMGRVQDTGQGQGQVGGNILHNCSVL